MKKFLVISIVLFAFTFGAVAQSTDTEQTTATAVIVGPLALTKVSDMNFGTIATTGTAGTVALGTDGTRTPTDVALVGAATGTPASFTINGEASRAFTVTLPADGTVSLVNGGNSMDADSFIHNAPAQLDGGGAAAFSVGATLSVEAAQAPGTYTSANFPVTINYN